MRSIDSDQFGEFRIQFESQSLRHVRRYLDYEKRLKRGEASEEFFQWLGKILFDDQVYNLSEKALAFEIAAGERIVELWGALEAAKPLYLFAVEPMDRLAIYFGVIDEGASWEQRAAFWRLLAARYVKHWNWMEDTCRFRDEINAEFSSTSGGHLFAEYCAHILQIDPSLGAISAGKKQDLARVEEQIERDTAAIKALEGDLEFAEDRAQRAHIRLKKQEEEILRLRRQIAEERENGEKLRSERRTRISTQRQSNQSQKDLEHLRREYVKLDARLKDMASRLELSEQLRMQGAGPWNVHTIQQMSLYQLLGVEGASLSAEELGQIRRRFASVLHPDRARGLPAWTTSLFAEIMGTINEACDRVK